MADMPQDARNNQVYLKQVPEGLLGPDDFEVRQAPVPQAGDGEVVVQAHYLSLDAALRLIVRDSKDFLFRVEPGDLVRNSVAGKIVASNHPDWSAGDYVIAGTGVQNYGISDGSDLERCDITQAPLSAWLGGFGVSGLTAYFAIFEDCKPQPGQTVVINGAAGAVGTMAGQFAKMTGAQVIGIAGGPEKCAWLVDELGFDAAIDYKAEHVSKHLHELCPEGINVFFDNVGGDILEAALNNLANSAKVVICGGIVGYNEEELPSGPRNYMNLVLTSSNMEGFLLGQFGPKLGQAAMELGQ